MELQIRLKKKRANIVFRGKETTKKVPPKIFRGFKVKKKRKIDVLKAKTKHER